MSSASSNDFKIICQVSDKEHKWKQICHELNIVDMEGGDGALSSIFLAHV